MPTRRARLRQPLDAHSEVHDTGVTNRLIGSARRVRESTCIGVAECRPAEIPKSLGIRRPLPLPSPRAGPVGLPAWTLGSRDFPERSVTACTEAPLRYAWLGSYYLAWLVCQTRLVPSCPSAAQTCLQDAKSAILQLTESKNCLIKQLHSFDNALSHHIYCG